MVFICVERSELSSSEFVISFEIKGMLHGSFQFSCSSPEAHKYKPGDEYDARFILDQIAHGNTHDNPFESMLETAMCAVSECIKMSPNETDFGRQLKQAQFSINRCLLDVSQNPSLNHDIGA